jgi:hypothetical protein
MAYGSWPMARVGSKRRNLFLGVKRAIGHWLSAISHLKKPVAFLDVQVNHITKDVGHINNKVFQKTAQR